MSGAEKAEALTKAASSGLPKRRALGELGVPKSTYYRWLRRKEQQGLEDDVGASTPPWNKLASKEVDSVLSRAREMPELSPRQLAHGPPTTWASPYLSLRSTASCAGRGW